MAYEPRWEYKSEIPNSYGITKGETITAYNSGIHTVLDIQPNNKGSFDVTYNQIFSIWGQEINMERPAVCDVKYCKPALLLLPEYKKKLKWLTSFIQFLESESQRTLK